MIFRVLCSLLSVTLAGGTAYGQTIDTVGAETDSAVTYSGVVSPETFTFNDNVAWAVKSLRRPDRALGKAVIMYGYGATSVCEESPQARKVDTHAALAVQRPDRWNSPLFSVMFYETVEHACKVWKNPYIWAKRIPGYPAGNDTTRNFEDVIDEIHGDGSIHYDSFIFSVGRLPNIGRGHEIWAFCDDIGQCLGHKDDTSFVFDHLTE